MDKLFIKRINKHMMKYPTEILDEAQDKIIVEYGKKDRNQAFGSLYFKGHIMPLVSGYNGKDPQKCKYLATGEYDCYQYKEDNNQ